MRILTALDRSEYAEIVLEHGLDQAARHPGSELHFMTVIDDDREAAAARSWLDRIVSDGLETFRLADRPVFMHVKRGRPASSVAALAYELPADLLVIGRFHVPSESDVIIDIVECPTLVIGVEGHVLEPQCSACRATRRASDGEQLFCARHRGDRIPDLVTRLPPASRISGYLW